MASLANGAGGQGEEVGKGEEEEVSHRSSLARAYRAEIDDSLRQSLVRRTERIKQQVAVLSGGEPSAARRPSQPVLSEALQQAAVKALREACLATRPISKVFGPTRRQSLQLDPPEPDEEILGEGTVLSATLESLERNIGSRRRQIVSLQHQAVQVKALNVEQEAEVNKSNERHKKLEDGTLKVQSEHDAVLKQLRSEIAELSRAIVMHGADGERLEKLARQQTRFFMQSKQIARSPGGEAVALRSQAGELAMVPMPPPLPDEPDHEHKYDIGTAAANPYVVDSWPFEPNVLKSRTPKDVPMPPCKEETVREMQDEAMRMPYRCIGLPVRDDESEGDEDDNGPTTARSM